MQNEKLKIVNCSRITAVDSCQLSGRNRPAYRTGRLEPRCRKKYLTTSLLTVIFAGFFLFIITGFGYAFNETHLDSSILPRGCGECHKSHGARATVMLDLPKNEICLKCHGTIKRGTRGQAKTDILSSVIKSSNHPVLQTSQYHITGESFPEKSPSTQRHVSCYDCHNPHLSTKDNPLSGVRGYSGRGVTINSIKNEFQVCYKCHSDSANLPSNAGNIAQEFDTGNASYHPIESAGVNSTVPSLLGSLTTLSIIKCSDCHGNDDKAGPKGVHGSNYDHILKDNYSMQSGSEGPHAYELCYGCHSRGSIIEDESFKSHKKHVLYSNTSCYACHDAHGSPYNENLINFDISIVSTNSTGQLNYMKLSPGKPRCFLNCHVDGVQYDHKITGFEYCVNTNCIPGW
ncbi:hypothetical protein H8E50_01055 [bacterium]|nr:hypothetical protein [bacterium]